MEKNEVKIGEWYWIEGDGWNTFKAKVLGKGNRYLVIKYGLFGKTRICHCDAVLAPVEVTNSPKPRNNK